MSYYIKTTQIPNLLMDDLLKVLSFSELKVLLTILRKTIGIVHPKNKGERLERAWISQKLFMVCTALSGRAVSSAIESLIKKELIEVTNTEHHLLHSKSKRRSAARLYFASRLRLDLSKKQTSEPNCIKPVTPSHTIKLNIIKQSCYTSSQGIQKISDTVRYQQIQNHLNTLDNKNTD